ncbi:c-type cytochrome [Nisaea nitritireducens]|uniref:c-type cytochrome n=1 Tax=Nisaea nitritireducens TaxID=568392 RepID=UPI001867F4C6|nr:c-type cytochrome [Nisaea nitritireducens]
MSKFLNLAALTFAVGLAGGAMAEPTGLGRPATPDEVAAWDIDVRPDGLGLPEGSGSVEAGEPIFAERCASCHGDFGEAVDRWPVLAGGIDTLTSARPVKTIGSYWPYLSTVWDYVHRAMPFGDAQSLTADETYALTAYLLYLNDLVDDDFELSRDNFTEVAMPNAAGFYPDDRTESAVWKSRTPCMTDCKPEVKITARAQVVDVTPDDPTSKHSAAAPAADEAAAEKDEATQVAAAPAVDPALVKAGEKVFKKCKACHAVGDKAKHKIGPHLNGIFGRAAGTAEGFKKYSKDMKGAGADGLVWDEETLATFLAKPKSMIKRTKMAFAGLKKEDDLTAVIAYLKAMTE